MCPSAGACALTVRPEPPPGAVSAGHRPAAQPPSGPSTAGRPGSNEEFPIVVARPALPHGPAALAGNASLRRCLRVDCPARAATGSSVGRSPASGPTTFRAGPASNEEFPVVVARPALPHGPAALAGDVSVRRCLCVDRPARAVTGRSAASRRATFWAVTARPEFTSNGKFPIVVARSALPHRDSTLTADTCAYRCLCLDNPPRVRPDGVSAGDRPAAQLPSGPSTARPSSGRTGNPRSSWLTCAAIGFW
jgi:hypothetical protein